MTRWVWSLVGAFFIVAALLGGTLDLALAQAPAAKPKAEPCTPPLQIAIQDLGMRPDPVLQGQPIRQWIVTLKSDRTWECRTSIEIMDGDQLAGAEVERVIKPGTHRYTVRVAPEYRFQQLHHCFAVLAKIAGSLELLDAAKRFCARSSWTLREPPAERREREGPPAERRQ